MLQQQMKLFSTIPREVKTFLLRAILLFAGWKLLYIFVLIPQQVPDAPLVRYLGDGTAQLMNWAYADQPFSAVHTTREKIYGTDTVMATYSMVMKGQRKVLGIYQACNGLELMILYAGFIICFTGSWKRKILYITGGVVGLYIINVLRCAMLVYIGLEYPKQFDIAHKYIFNLVIYAFAFLLWIFYVNGLRKSAYATKGS
jgi:exosortase family protein XrtF